MGVVAGEAGSKETVKSIGNSQIVCYLIGFMKKARRSFTVKTENGDIRLMTQSEVNDFVKKTIQRAKVTSSLSSSLPNSRAGSPSNRMTLFSMPKTLTLTSKRLNATTPTTELFDDRESTTSSVGATFGHEPGESRDENNMHHQKGRQSSTPPEEVVTMSEKVAKSAATEQRQSPALSSGHAERVRGIRQSMIRARQVREAQRASSGPQAAAATSVSRFDALVSPPNDQVKKQFSWSTTGDDVASVEELVEDFVSSDALDLRPREKNAAEKHTQKKTSTSKFTSQNHLKMHINTKAPSHQATTTHDQAFTRNEENRKRNKKLHLSAAINFPQAIVNEKEVKKKDTVKSLSHDDIRKIVMASMERAQQSARTEIESLVAKAGKQTADEVPDYFVFQKEVASIALDAMHRARESAQNEIRGLVKESLRRAPESEQSKIRQIVRESMQKARESAKQEMSGLVRKIVKLHAKTPRENAKGSDQERENEEVIIAKTQDARFHKECLSRNRSMLSSKIFDRDEDNVDEKTPDTSPAKVSTQQGVHHVMTSLAEKPSSCERSSKRCSVYLSPGPGRLDYQFFGSDTEDTQRGLYKSKNQEDVPFDETGNGSAEQEQDRVASMRVINVMKQELDNSEPIMSKVDKDIEQQGTPTLDEARKPGNSDLVSPVSSKNSSRTQSSYRSSSLVSPEESMRSPLVQQPQKSSGEAKQYSDPQENSRISSRTQRSQTSYSETKEASISLVSLKTDSQAQLSSQSENRETKHDQMSPVRRTTSSPTQRTVGSPSMGEKVIPATDKLKDAAPSNLEANIAHQRSPSMGRSSPLTLSTPSMQMSDSTMKLAKIHAEEKVEQEISKHPLSPFTSDAPKKVQSPQSKSPRSTEPTSPSANQNHETELQIKTGSTSVSLESNLAKPEYVSNEVKDSYPIKTEHKESRPNSPNIMSMKNELLSIAASGDSRNQLNPTKRLAAMPQTPASSYLGKNDGSEHFESPHMSNLTLEQTPSTLAVRQSNYKKSPKKSPVIPDSALATTQAASGKTSPRNGASFSKPRRPRSPFARPNRREAAKSPLRSPIDSVSVQGNLVDDCLSPSNRSLVSSSIHKKGKKLELLGHSGIEKYDKPGLLSKAQRSKSTSRLNSRMRSPYLLKRMPRSSSVPRVSSSMPKPRQNELQVNTAASDESLWTDADSPVKSTHASPDLQHCQKTAFQKDDRLKIAPNDCENIVTDEFLARIASRKGSKITATELQMLLESTAEERTPSEVIETVLSASSRGSALLEHQYKHDRTCMGFWDFWASADEPADRRELLEEEDSGPTWAESHNDDEDNFSENLSCENATAIRTSRPSFSFSGSDECDDDDDDDDLSLVTYEEDDEENCKRQGWSWW